MTLSLEEAHESLREYVDCLAHHGGTGCDVHETAEADVYDAARALALAAFKMGVNVRTPLGHTWNYEDDEQRRIEALGR